MISAIGVIPGIGNSFTAYLKKFHSTQSGKCRGVSALIRCRCPHVDLKKIISSLLLSPGPSIVEITAAIVPVTYKHRTLFTETRL